MLFLENTMISNHKKVSRRQCREKHLNLYIYGSENEPISVLVNKKYNEFKEVFDMKLRQVNIKKNSKGVEFINETMKFIDEAVSLEYYHEETQIALCLVCLTVRLLT